MKKHTKVWKFNSEQVRNRSHRTMYANRMSLQILAPSIESAREMTGVTFEGKERVLKRLNVLFDEPESHSALASSENGESEDDDAGPESEDDNALVLGTGCNQCSPRKISFPGPHRAIYEPVVRLPPIFGDSTPSYVYRGYPSVDYPSSIEADESLLALDTDEKSLFEELREEVELDNRDRLEAEKNERVLWGEFGRRRVGVSASKAIVKVEDVEDDAHAHALRYKAPEVGGKVKSTVFVNDSD